MENLNTVPDLEKVLGVVPGIIYVFNQKTQSNVYANRSLGEMLGYSTEEIQALGDSFLPTLCHPEDLPVIGGHFEAINKLIGNDVLTVEYRIRHKDGHWVWLSSRDTVFERDADGSVVSHIGSATDITANKESDLAVSLVRDELETIFHAATSGIVALGKQGEVVRINNHARHMLGGISTEVPFPWPEQIKFLDAETLHPLDASADPIQRALSGHSLRSETHLLKRLQEGEPQRYVRVDNANPASNDSGIRTVLVMDDVSNEERNRQVIERKSRLDALGQLTGGIAHDFNNLLASLMYAIDLAGRVDDEDRRAKYLETAIGSISEGRALTARLLAFARRQPGLASAKFTSDVFKNFENLMRPMLEAQISLTLTLEDENIRHFCDQTQLETALMNLVLNARDAILRSGKGSRIEIHARPVMAADKELDARQKGADTSAVDPSAFRYVKFTVSDNGPGMDEETLARCTDPFFTTKDTNSGTGLGLAIVYGFVRQSDGDMRIYSEPDVGTTVHILLPLGTDQGAREGAVQNAELLRGQGQTILLVEDELQLLVMMTDVLEDLGYQVISARSGQDALEIVEAGDAFDLLLTDVVMPGAIGGFDLARRVRALRPEMPVLYTSGYTGFTASEMGEIQAPLLHKPASPSELSEVLMKVLNNAL